MAWKEQRTRSSVTVDADVDLDDFSELQLLQGLIHSDWISKAEAEAIQKRAEKKEKTPVILAGVDPEELLTATDYMHAGNKTEALIHLERWLGREWIGRLA